MRVTVIGGTGHVGGYLVPRLSASGCDVTVVTRGKSTPYRRHGAWDQVELVVADREAEEAAGTFGERIAALDPDVVIDMICFTEESARQLVEAVRGRVGHLLHCGTISVHGPSRVLPTTEAAPRRPIDEYGVGKAAVERYLLDQAHRHGLPATVIHPGHITGPGWVPVNPAGNLDPAVFQRLVDGAELVLPNLGLETLQHVHADDVAALFTAAMASRSTAVGESFHSVGATTLTLRGYAEAVAAWYGREANLVFQPYDRWRENVPDRDARATWNHIAHSPHCSMAKAERLLGYRPRFGALEAVQESVDWLVAHGELTAPA
ncbi:NAD(P)-dependent oxidoreductase [Plantactinospora sp. BB1]|uniref:NAD-dependent epimerase/dehydratase family protein n=1 Tax=Plantactinospora sp. BB1 TaxID=2071627 RepID=UPI000D16DE91|nr:NAD-dependent epimerase/dehydratase family protein [Plantactinospora sp. BB1]AVT38620.1 epimerase [Plantactinospora sp. BB1]